MGSMFEREAKAQAIFILGLPAVAGVIAVIMTQVTRWTDASRPAFWIGIAGMVVGYILLVYTKWHQIKRGDFFSWGVAGATKGRKSLYVLSYCLMVFGFFLAGLSGRF